MPRINLLPWREEIRKERQKQFGIAAGAAVLMGFGLMLFVAWTIGRFVSHQNARNDFLNQEIAILDRQIEEINGLEAQKERLLARMEIIEQLQRSRPEIVHLFDDIARTVPEGVYLSAIGQTGNRLEMQGVAQSNTRVSAYMRNMDDSDWMDKPDLDVVETKQDGRFRHSEFKLFAQQVTTGISEDDTGGPQ